MAKQHLVTRIHQLVEGLEPELIEVRRHLHQHPELSHKEFETAKYLVQRLEQSQLKVTPNVGETGILADLENGNGGARAALRADMDALPIAEESGLDYASRTPGISHACGHDVHMAAVYGAARILDMIREEVPGDVRFIFQPAEEVGPGGAVKMIEDGALEGVDAIWSLHVDPSMPVGKVGLRSGPMLAAADSFELQIIGKGTHAAHPHRGIDPIAISALVINAIQQVVSRRVNPNEPVVVSFGKIEGGHAANVIPTKVTLLGTMRTLDLEMRKQVPQLIEDITDGITRGMGGSYKFKVTYGSPPVINDERLTHHLAESVIELMGEDAVHFMPWPLLGGEDFAWYQRRVPGCYMRLGTQGNAATSHYLHTPNFNIDEKALPIAVKVLTWNTIQYLQSHGHQSAA